MLFDLGVDVIFPPLTKLVVVIGAGVAASTAVAVLSGFSAVSWVPWTLASAGVVVYVFRGVHLAGLGARGFADLLWAPVYVGWKLVLRVTHKSEHSGEWVRTARETK